MLDRFPDGVWFVELAALTDGQLVPQAVATVLGIKEEAGRPVTEALVKFVRGRCLLLVLDNCEHVLTACATLAQQLLDAGEHVRILASSREYLRLAGESAFVVPALPTPDASSTATPATLGPFESVRLFVERATATQPAFRLTAQTRRRLPTYAGASTNPASARACRRTRGSLPVQTIAARLSDRFRLLASGNQVALPRQQTLRALIDWSHDLLDEPERVLFRRLAVFAGGWTLEAAEAVTAGHALADTDVIDVHSRLVEKSLVALDVARARYRFLDTVRAYASERLEASGEGEALRELHLAGFVNRGGAGERRVRRSEPGRLARKFDLEREDVLAALQRGACERRRATGA